MRSRVAFALRRRLHGVILRVDRAMASQVPKLAAGTERPYAAELPGTPQTARMLRRMGPGMAQEAA
jgi:hypothetical protein